MIGYIYITINKTNSKFYIGKHKKDTYDKNYYGSGVLIKQALDKYGKENFINQIICTCDTEQDLNESEKKWIKYYKELFPNLCYNLAEGGEGGDTTKYKTPEEIEKFREKMTLINRQRCSTQEFKEKLSKAMKQRYSTQEAREEQRAKVKAT